MTYKEAYDLLVREHIEDRDWSQQSWEAKEMLGQLVERHTPKKPKKTETVYGVDGCGETTNKLILFTCPVCDEPIHVGRGCSNNDCRQAIDWSPEKQILKNAKALQIPRPRIVEEEGDEE